VFSDEYLVTCRGFLIIHSPLLTHHSEIIDAKQLMTTGIKILFQLNSSSAEKLSSFFVEAL
jgi:hypothetical protein